MTLEQEAIQMKAYLMRDVLNKLEKDNENGFMSKEERRNSIHKLRRQLLDLLEICGVTEF